MLRCPRFESGRARVVVRKTDDERPKTYSPFHKGLVLSLSKEGYRGLYTVGRVRARACPVLDTGEWVVGMSNPAVVI